MISSNELEIFVEIEKNLSCFLCKKTFDNPYSLPCHHNFCRYCITNALANDNRCPICFRVSQPKELIRSFLLGNMTQSLDRFHSFICKYPSTKNDDEALQTESVLIHEKPLTSVSTFDNQNSNPPIQSSSPNPTIPPISNSNTQMPISLNFEKDIFNPPLNIPGSLVLGCEDPIFRSSDTQTCGIPRSYYPEYDLPIEHQIIRPDSQNYLPTPIPSMPISTCGESQVIQLTNLNPSAVKEKNQLPSTSLSPFTGINFSQIKSIHSASSSPRELDINSSFHFTQRPENKDLIAFETNLLEGCKEETQEKLPLEAVLSPSIKAVDFLQDSQLSSSPTKNISNVLPSQMTSESSSEEDNNNLSHSIPPSLTQQNTCDEIVHQILKSKRNIEDLLERNSSLQLSQSIPSSFSYPSDYVFDLPESETIPFKISRINNNTSHSHQIQPILDPTSPQQEISSSQINIQRTRTLSPSIDSTSLYHDSMVVNNLGQSEFTQDSRLNENFMSNPIVICCVYDQESTLQVIQKSIAKEWIKFAENEAITLESSSKIIILETIPSFLFPNKRLTRCSLEYLKALVLGFWIIDIDWLVKSLQIGRLLPYSQFEIDGIFDPDSIKSKLLTSFSQSIPSIARTYPRSSNGSLDLFSGFTFHLLYDPSSSLTSSLHQKDAQQAFLADIINIIEGCNGKVIRSALELKSFCEGTDQSKSSNDLSHPHLKGIQRRPLILILTLKSATKPGLSCLSYSNSSNQHEPVLISFPRGHQLPLGCGLSISWVFHSISQFALLDVAETPNYYLPIKSSYSTFFISRK